MPASPSISFTNSVRQPIEVINPWRDTIGIVGEFSKGPSEPRTVNPTEFEQIFGKDTKSGSLAVQQAIAAGATKFVISRAVPADRRSNAEITFASKNVLNIPPIVGQELASSSDVNPTINSADFTIGLSLQLNYVGSPVVTRSIYESVKTKAAFITRPGVTSELGVVHLFVTDFKAGGETIRQAEQNETLKATSVVSSVGNYQVISLSTTDSTGHDYSSLSANLLPGYRLVSSGEGAASFLIVSKPFDLEDGAVGIVVKTLIDSGAELNAGLKVADPDLDTYIIGYRVTTKSGGSISAYGSNSSYFALSNEVYTDAYADNTVHNYFALQIPSGGLTNEWQRFEYLTHSSAYGFDGAAALSKEHFGNSGADQGIQYSFGKKPRLLKGGQLYIPYAISEVMVGSDTEGSSLAYSVGTNFKRILTDLRTAIYADDNATDLISEVSLKVNSYPYQVKLTSTLDGQESNRVTYAVSRYCAGTASQALDLQISVNGSAFDFEDNYDALTNFSGGVDGSRRAYKDFYAADGTPDIRVEATSPGVSKVRVTITPEDNGFSVGGYSFGVKTTETLGNVVTTQYAKLNTNAIDPQTGLFLNADDLTSVRVYSLPYLEVGQGTIPPEFFDKLPLRLAPPLGLYSSSLFNSGATAVDAVGSSLLSDVSLENGSDYEVTSDSTAQEVRRLAYLDAVRQMASQDIAVLVIAGLPYTGSTLNKEVFDEAVKQAREATPDLGLRQLIFETAPNFTPNMSSYLSSSVNSEYVTLVDTRITQRLDSGAIATNVGLGGLYAGTWLTNPPQVAPHSIGIPNIIQSVNRRLEPSSKELLSQGRVDALYFDRARQTWKFLNGLTTSNEVGSSYSSSVRIKLQLTFDLFQILSYSLSQNNSRALHSEIENTARAYMFDKARQGWIQQLGDVICNESNNTEATIGRGLVYLDISYIESVPADTFRVSMVQDYTLLTLALPAAA